MIPGVEGFRERIAAEGFIPPERIEPGLWARFSVDPHDPRNRDGCAMLFADCEGGHFKDWSSGESWDWQAHRERLRTPAEARAFKERIERARADAERQRAEEARQTAENAAKLWQDAEPADDSHPYLARKGVGSYSLRVYRGPRAVAGMRCDGALIVPSRTSDGSIVSLQFIGADGEKRYLPGPRPAGAYFSIGKPSGTICVAEGYATGASVHAATGHAVAVAFDAGNLLATAKAMRAKYPDARIILCADNDLDDAKPNRGVIDATTAAKAIGGLLAVPELEGRKCDFNDLAKAKGGEAVKKALEAAQPPSDGPEAQPRPQIAPSAVLEGGWPTPKPLPEGLPPVMPFSFDLLPDSLRPWAEDICERVQCPPDFVAVTVMAALGSVIGRQVAIRPQEQTDWDEFSNQWAIVIGRPGVLKTPAMEAALGPLKRLAAKAAEAHADEMQDFEAQKRVVKLKQEAGEKSARKKLATSLHADVTQDLSIPDPEEPPLRRYIANDTSYESLGEILRTNTNGILVNRDELVALLKGLDREDGASARGFYLTGWGGHSSYTFDRITRPGARLEAICLSVLGSAQPGRIAEYIKAAVKGGALDDGLIQRFGLLVWPDISKEWKDVDRFPDSEAKASAYAAFEALDKIDPVQIGATQDRDANGNPERQPYLRFNAEALEIFRVWREKLEARLRGGELSPALESHLSKYRKLVPSLALILHLASNGQGDVTERALVQALAWAEYLETHAQRAYSSAANPDLIAAKAILNRLRKGDLPIPFAARDIYRKGWAGLSDRQQVADGLEMLSDLDWIAPRERVTQGRTATEFDVNPRGLA